MKEGGRSSSRWLIWLLFAVVLTALLSTTTLSRYLTNISGSGAATIAAVDMNASLLSFEAADLLPGGTQVFPFAVANHSGGKVSGVAQSYSITLTTRGSLPLTYELQCTGTDGKGQGIYTAKTAITPGTLVPGGRLPAGVATTHDYTLTATWPAQDNNASYSGKLEQIVINVQAEQIAPSAL